MKISTKIFLLIIFNMIGSCDQSNTKPIPKISIDDFELEYFKPLPKEYALKDRAYLIDKIIPKKNYAYWECLFNDSYNLVKDRGDVIVYNGDSLHFSSYAKKVNTTSGFFIECHPLICFSYIVGINNDKSIEVFDTNEGLKSFIGTIDNIEEAILTAKINEYWYDTDSIIGGAYREITNDYLLYLLEYSSTPVTYKSVKALLTKEGDFSIIGKEIYRQTDEYIIE